MQNRNANPGATSGATTTPSDSMTAQAAVSLALLAVLATLAAAVMLMAAMAHA